MKHPSLSKFMLFFMFLLFVSCTTGTKFSFNRSDMLTLNETTIEDVLSKYGKPYKETSIIKDSNQLKRIDYYSQTGSITGKGVNGCIPQRYLMLTFKNDKLVGYEYTSSFEEDTTMFDSENAYKIEKGKTTRNQVIELMGKRYGERMYPLTDEKEERALLYNYIENKPGKKFYKILKVTYDERGIVKNVDLSQNG